MSNPLHLVCPHCDTTNRIPEERLGDVPYCGRCKQAIFTGHPVELTSANFEPHISRNDTPVVVDFWAPWCGPCQRMAPSYERAAAELEPNIRLAKLNTEQEQGIAARFGIRSIPTLVIFKKGGELARQAGAMGVQDIARWVRMYM